MLGCGGFVRVVTSPLAQLNNPSRSSFVKRSPPVGERRGFKCPAFIQRRSVGMEIPRNLAAAAVPSQGEELGLPYLLLLFVFIVWARHSCGVHEEKHAATNSLGGSHPSQHDGAAG